jgi:hypothetical protein
LKILSSVKNNIFFVKIAPYMLEAIVDQPSIDPTSKFVEHPLYKGYGRKNQVCENAVDPHFR